MTISNDAQAIDQKNNNKHALLQHTYFIITLVIIAAVSYLSFYAPILYSDDWSLMLGRWYYGNLYWFDLTEQRPLLKVCLVILYSIFGLNVHAFYSVLWILNVLNAVLLYFLILRLIPKSALIAVSIAMIALVYPADFTHMWLTMIQIRTVAVMTLLYAYLLLVHADTGHRVALWGALLCLIISFGIYEGQLGIAMTWCLLMILRRKPRSWKNWLNLSLPLFVGVGFVLWRTLSYLLLGIGNPHGYFYRLQLTPLVVIQRLLEGHRVLIWVWLEPLIHAFDLKVWQAIFILLLMITFLVFVAYLVTRFHPKLQGRLLSHQQYLSQLRCFMLMIPIGTIFISAGYIPYIMFFEPSYFPFPLSSRGNLFALPGAATTLVALITVVVLLLSRKRTQINFMVLAGVLPLIFWGMIVQIQVQYDNRVSWEWQKQIWRELFELVPDLEDGTSVYLILSHHENQTPSFNKNGVRPPVGPKASFRVALNMLYGKYNLDGDVFIKETLFMEEGFILKKLFLKEGVTGYTREWLVPYDRIIFLAYDGNPKRLRIIEDLEAENLVDFPITDYAPYEHIIETPMNRVDWRWLVGVASVFKGDE